MSSKVRYREQWDVPSDSDPDRTYVVSLTLEGQYQCSCKHWIFRCQKNGTDCKHIQDVKNGVYSHEPKQMFKLTFGMVKEVALQDDLQTVMLPLRPIGDSDFLLTILYDCIQLGVDWKEIRELEHAPRWLTKDKVINHVRFMGRKVYKEWIPERGWTGFEYVNV